MNGLITKTSGSAYSVLLDDGHLIEAHIKGNFRIQGIRSTNPVAVGDRVTVQQLPDGTSWITTIADRRNYIVRRSTNLSKQSHILAANIDQVALIVTVDHPRTSTTFIDRFLATCEAYNVPSVLIFNKIDLLNQEGLQELQYLRALYSDLGYPCYVLSAKQLLRSTSSSDAQPQEGVSSSPQSVASSAPSLQLQEVARIFTDKTTLLSGNSGVGKSTLLNALFGSEITRTGLISDAHDKGMHTTTFSQMFFLKDSPLLTTAPSDAATASLYTAIAPPAPSAPSNVTAAPSGAALASPETAIASPGPAAPSGAVIDTPGIKGFGTFDFKKEEVGHYFREIFRLSADCRFSNCTHSGEPGCAILPALEEGRIAPSRFESYLSLLGDCTESKYR